VIPYGKRHPVVLRWIPIKNLMALTLTLTKLAILISQGSATTQLRRGGQCNKYLVAKFIAEFNNEKN